MEPSCLLKYNAQAVLIMYFIFHVPSCRNNVISGAADIVRAYTPKDARCLELFARNLQPGVTSWGNEIIPLHQYTQKTIYLHQYTRSLLKIEFFYKAESCFNVLKNIGETALMTGL